MKQPETNKASMYKGLQRIFLAILLMFIGPVIINSAFKNQEHFLYYPVLLLGCGICLTAMYLFFKGLQKLVNGIFNE